MSERPCSSCGTANEADARFCEGCGRALDRRCTACGTPASATARFCRSCGGSLDGRTQMAPAGPTRKTVTVLFADLAGSTSFEEKVDAETAREVMGQYHNLLRQTGELHRAGVMKYIGDGFMAVWGVPEISAGDADYAVDAAVELQERFVALAARVAESHGEALALRVAVNTGEVVVGSGDADLVGDALNVAARLESQCPHGHVVVGEETWRATRGRYRYEPLSSVQVKGRTAPVAVYQWAGRRSEPADSIPFVGRNHEFRRLQTVLDDAVNRRDARLVTVVGDPGVGKTRLGTEFAAAQSGAVVLQFRCAAEGTVALAPLVGVLRTRDLEADLPVTVPERDRILRDLNGMTEGVAGSVEETFWGLRRYFEVLAARSPLILILDDIHWADVLLLDFVEHLSEWVRDAPIVMVALARPELRETRPELLTVGGWVEDAIRLGGLEPAATAELAARVLGSDRLPTELLARLPSSTGGNPLFVRELVAMLVHDGVLVAKANGWRLTIDADAISVPPTIQALLASRLERMNTADRRVLETASVIGTDFSPAAVCALSGASQGEVKASLDRLRRMELAEPSGAYVGDDPVWRFHHILIRDVAYRRLLKSDRGELHERFADWILAGARTGLFESDELVARHLESAHGYRCELNSRDGNTAELALRSARCYLSAARRALDRDALVSAGAQAARGAALADADSALRAQLLLVGCEAFLSAGDVASGAPLVDELDRVADDALAPWAICYRCQFIVYTDPSRLLEVDERLQEAIDEFARRGDPGGSAKAYRVRAGVRGRLGRIGEAEADLFEALIAARRDGDHRQITAALGAAPNAALWGPSPAPKAGGRCLDVVRMQRMTTAAPSLEATSLRCLAVLELLRGRPDKARSMLADAREIVSELGLRHGLMETELYAGIIESMVGDPVAAEPHFRMALEGLDSLGVGADAGQAAALLARSLLAQGRIDEADRYAAESERIAGHNLKTAIGWRAVRAEILCTQGRHEEAVAMARDAVEVAAETDLVLDYADACLTLSRVLADSGDSGAAAAARGKAESLYAAKDAVFLVGQNAARPTPESAVSPARDKTSRLTSTNSAAEVPALLMQDQLRVSNRFVYEDRRRVAGEPLVGGVDLHAAGARKLEQYPHVEAPVLAVRGERVALHRVHWWDDAGNETTSLDLSEMNEARELEYHGRFDEDDFQAAYVEMEHRYYAGEAKAFAANGLAMLGFVKAFWKQDVEAARQTVQSDFRWCAAPSAMKPGERSLEEIFAWRAERLAQVASFQDWLAAVRWLSPGCCISLATARDSDEYRWERFYVSECRDGRYASCREFDITDEDAAFAYAESIAARTPSRLAVSNRISGAVGAGWRDVQAHDVDLVLGLYSDQAVYDDRRGISGERLDRAGLRAAAMRLFATYPRVRWRPLAVRGETLELVCGEWSDDAGSKAVYFDLYEFGNDDLIEYHGRFDEDDFAGAYTELERRYYSGAGAEYAGSGQALAGWSEGIARRDIETVRRFSTPDFCWFAAASSLKAAERTVEDVFAWMRARGQQVSSQRYWQSAIHWVSATCAVGCLDISAIGQDGEEYLWNSFVVSRLRDGLLASVREFETEEEAFAYAEGVVARRPSRLTLVNHASEAGHRLMTAMNNGDADVAAACYSQKTVIEDRRQLSRTAIADRAGARAAFERMFQDYNNFKSSTLAVRGQELALSTYVWSGDAGYQSSGLVLHEIDHEGLIVFTARFDEEAFAAAYAELERRYYAGEAAAFADYGTTMADYFATKNCGDLDRLFNSLSSPDLRLESRSRSVFSTRSAAEHRASVEELTRLVGSARDWISAVQHVSPTWGVARYERQAVGRDGEDYQWERIVVAEIRDGRLHFVCEFDVDDEDAAFAYAEECARASSSRLSVTNRASAVQGVILAALQSRDFDAAADANSDSLVYDDHRHLSGEAPFGREGIRAAWARLADDYSRFEGQTLAVRGERLVLGSYACSNEGGNETTGLVLNEVGEDGQICYSGRFDEDDFQSAYRELDRRFFAGEGAAFAGNESLLSVWVLALNRLDLEAARTVCLPSFRVVSSPTTLAVEDRSLAEFFRWLSERADQAPSVRHWTSADRWLSNNCVVSRVEIRAVVPDGVDYSWPRISVAEIRDGLLAHIRQFDIDDEEAAFAYADTIVGKHASRLPSTNTASEVAECAVQMMHTRDIDAFLDFYSDAFVFDDHRRLSGDPIIGRAAMRTAAGRTLSQYASFEPRCLAIRGTRLTLGATRWSDHAGNVTADLHVVETGGDGRIVYDGRFDEDDLEGAYAELERRHYAGEGAEFAEAGLASAGYVATLNRGDFDTVFNELTWDDLRLENRSRSAFPDRTAADLRNSLEQLYKMVESIRSWFSSIAWVSPTTVVSRMEREATGLDGEPFEWSRILVGTWRDGRLASLCDFEATDEVAAFAYAYAAA